MPKKTTVCIVTGLADPTSLLKFSKLRDLEDSNGVEGTENKTTKKEEDEYDGTGAAGVWGALNTPVMRSQVRIRSQNQ